MKRFAIVVALLAVGCKKQASSRTDDTKVPPMAEAEVKRGQDACNTYVESVCACAAKVPDVAKQCELARALPDAVRIGLEVAASPDSKPDIVLQTHSSIRKTVAECIEQLARLPALGCQ